MKLQKDLREFVELLLSRGVDFVVVGGHAVAFHGYPRLTDDLDLLVRPTRENGQRVVDALVEFGFGAVGMTADDFVAPQLTGCLQRRRRAEPLGGAQEASATPFIDQPHE